MSVDRYVDQAGPRERIAWDLMKSELTAANERCVRLRSERDEAREKNEMALQWLAERDATRDALRKYGEHEPGCSYYTPDAPPYICTCGLDGALAFPIPSPTPGERA